MDVHLQNSCGFGSKHAGKHSMECSFKRPSKPWPIHWYGLYRCSCVSFQGWNLYEDELAVRCVYIYIQCVTVSHKQLWLVIFQTSICIRGHATEMVQLKKIKDLIHGSSNEQTGLEKVGKHHLLRSPKSRIYLADCHQGPIVDVTSKGIKCPVWFMESLNRIVISLNSGEFRCALGMKHMMPLTLRQKQQFLGTMHQGPQGTPTSRLHQEHKLIVWSYRKAKKSNNKKKRRFKVTLLIPFIKR